MGDIVPLRKREARVHDFVGLLFCGTRRAKQWQRALAAAGIESRVVDTFGEDETSGACKVSVPRSDLPAANELVTAVTRGDRRLPGAGWSWTSVIAIVVIVAILATLVAACGDDETGPLYEERVPIGIPVERIDDADDPIEVDDDSYDEDGLGAVPVFANPVGPACADPGAIVVDGTAWVACTGEGFPMLRSDDLASWTTAGPLFDERPAWASDDFWAPEIHRVGAGFVAYYSALATDRDQTCVGAARADAITGPWRDLGRPLVCDASVGIIDVHVFRDGDARYLYYKTEGNALAPQEPTVIVGQELGADGVTLVGERQALLSNTSDWEGDVVEAPWVIRRGGYYYLFYSGFRYCDDTYGVGVARSRSPLGPFAKRSDPMLASDDQFSGPGHTSVVAAGGQAWLVYHAWEGAHDCDDAGERVLMIDPVTWRGGWPRLD